MVQDDDRRWSQLMASAQAGDRRSYERLLREIIPVLRRFLHARWPAAQPAEIEDLVQDSLMSLHGARHTFIAGRPFLPWLLAIARHRLLDEWRRRARRQRQEDTLARASETISHLTANTEQDAAVEAVGLRRAVGQLPPRQRTAVELLKLREMSLKEAAEISGMSISALKVASHRAMKTLRVIFGGVG